eukprot:5000664-Pyramimonas_sp.AAC.1
MPTCNDFGNGTISHAVGLLRRFQAQLTSTAERLYKRAGARGFQGAAQRVSRGRAEAPGRPFR